MAKGKIRKSDLFESREIINALQQMKKEVDQTLKSFKQMGREAREINKAMKGAKSFRQYGDAAKKAGKNINALSSEEKKLLNAKKKLDFELSKQGKEYAKLNEKVKSARKANRDYAKSQEKGKKSTNTWSQAMGSFAAKFNTLGNIAANVASTISRKFVRALKGAFNVVTGFEQAMAGVKAITRASEEEFTKLEEEAKRLGGSTKFTASEVAGLQKEFAKLGFTTKQIIETQEATLDLAAATGEDLSRAAEVAGATVRQFGLSANQTQRVVDVMARSFTTSALNMEIFSESMKYVGPVANAAGLEVEEASAMIGLLANQGIKGSQAGTALRRIIQELGDESGDLTQRIQSLKDGGLNLAGSQDEVGRRAQTALLVLSEQIEKVPELTEVYQNAAGASEEMAQVQMDTLKGQLIQLKSAYEGLIIEATGSTTALEDSKETISGVSKLLNYLTENFDTVSKILKTQLDVRDWITGRKPMEMAIERVTNQVKNLQENYVYMGSTLGFVKADMEEFEQAVDEGDKAVFNLHEGLQQTGKTMETAFKDVKKFFTDAFSGEEEDEEGGTEKIENIKTLKAEIDKLEKKQETASLAEIAAINDTIAALREKLKVYEEATNELPEVLVPDDVVLDEMDGILSDLEEEYNEYWDNLTEGHEKFNEEWLERERQKSEKEKELQRQKEQATMAFIEESRRLGIETMNIFLALNDRKLEDIEAQTQKEISALEEKKEKGLISEEQFQNRKTKLEEKQAEESLKIRQRQARIEKTQALFDIAINTATAVMKVMAQLGTFAPFVIPLVIATGAAQAAAVAARPIPKYAEGGEVDGPSHKEGGKLIEAEGGEYIINKENTKKYKPLLSAINSGDIAEQKAGGVDFDGGRLDEISEKMDKIINKPTDSTVIRPGGIEYIRRAGTVATRRVENFRR